MAIIHIDREREGNPVRWLAPAFPVQGTYHRDAEIVWIDALEEALPNPIPVIESPETFNACEDEVARIRLEIQVTTQHDNAAYFENLETILRNIGHLRRTRPVMWCGLGVLGQDDPEQQALTQPYPIELLDRRLDTLAVLYAWLCGSLQDTHVPTRRPTYTYGQREGWIKAALGVPTEPKRWLVGHLCRVIKLGLYHPWRPDPSADIGRYPLYIPFETYSRLGDDDRTVLKRMAAQLEQNDRIRQIRQMLDDLGGELCHFRFDRWMDDMIVVLGRLDPNAKSAPPDPALAVTHWVSQMSGWIRAMHAWVDEEPLAEALTRPDVRPSLVRRTYAMLGQPSPVKTWLVASLSKTIRALGETYRPEQACPPQRFLQSR